MIMRRRLAAVAAIGLLATGCGSAVRPSGASPRVWIADSERPCGPDGRPTLPGARGCASSQASPGSSMGPSIGPSMSVLPSEPSSTPPPPWTGTAAEKRFAWAETQGFPEDAATVTLVKGRTPREALAMIATHRITPIEPATRVVRVEGEPVIAGRLGHGWTIVIEYNGFNATDDAVAARLSARGQAVVIYENVDADTEFLYAAGGRVVREFDPFAYDSSGRLAQERGIHFGDEGDPNPMAQSFLLAYRLTGVAVRASDVWGTSGRIGVACDLY